MAALKQHCASASRRATCRDDGKLAPRTVELIDSGTNHNGPGRTHWVAECNTTAIYVDAIWFDA